MYKSWQELKALLQEKEEMDYGTFDILKDCFTQEFIPKEDIPLVASRLSDSEPFFYLLCFSYQAHLHATNVNFQSNTRNLVNYPPFFDVVARHPDTVSFSLPFLEKENREKVLDIFFEKKPHVYVDNLTPDEILKYGVIPPKYQIPEFIQTHKNNHKLMYGFLSSLIKSDDSYHKSVPRLYGNSIAKYFSLLSGNNLKQVYELVKDTKLCCFLLANSHITQEMKLKALKCLSNYNYTFRFAHKITQDELLQLTPNQLYNFLSHLFKDIRSAKKEEINIVELPDKEKLKAFLLPVLMKSEAQEIDSFFEAYDIYNSVVSCGKSYKSILENIAYNLREFKFPVDRVSTNAELSKKAIEMFFDLYKVYADRASGMYVDKKPPEIKEERAKEIVTFLRDVLTDKEFQQLAHE